MKYFLGVDIGTSGAKTVLFNETFQTICSATFSYPLYSPQPMWAEQNPDDWFNATVDGIKAVIIDSKIDGKDICGLGLSGQMHGLVMLDKEDKVLRKSIIWCDQRTEKECAQITELIGSKRLIEITANPALTGFTASKIMWVKNNEPLIFKKCAKIMLPKDYVRYKLTGNFATEVSDASGMQLMNILERQWSVEICDKLGINIDFLPKMYESCENTGIVKNEICKTIGLNEGCVVAGGAGDQAASAIGNGVIREGIISDTIGTSGVVFAHTNKPLIDPLGRAHTFCHAVKNCWHIMGVTQGAGLSLQWFKNNFYTEEKILAQKTNSDIYDIMIDSVKDISIGSDGIIFLPYLLGERTPHLNPNAKGVFFGITNSSKKSTMLRAVLEGVAFSQKDCLSVINELGVEATEIRMAGGGSRNDYWREMFSDVFFKDVVTVNNSESGALGVAILASVACGFYSDVVEVCDKFISIKTRIAPKLENNIIYRESYEKYKALYQAVKKIY